MLKGRTVQGGVMSDYDTNCENRAYRHKQMMQTQSQIKVRPFRAQERSLAESVPSIKEGQNAKHIKESGEVK